MVPATQAASARMRTVWRFQPGTITTLALVLVVVGLWNHLGASRAAADEPSQRRAELARQLAPYYQPPQEFAGDLTTYASPLKFADGTTVRTAEDWQRRRKEILDSWHQRLGGQLPLLKQPQVKHLETVQRDGYREIKVHVQISDKGHLAEGYLMVPDGPGPFPAVLVPFYEPLTSISRGKVGQGTHDYGLQLVKRGFVTLSIGTPGSVEKPGLDTRQLLIEAGIEFDRQPLLLLAVTAANCHTALAQMTEVDPKRIGIIGLSYGGKWSMFASCLDDRFACAVWSDPGIVFNEENRNVNYWEPWYLGLEPGRPRRAPGVPTPENPTAGPYKAMRDAGRDLHELHALIAPRPFLVSGGAEDPPERWVALNHAVEVNRLLGYERRVGMTNRPEHAPNPESNAQLVAFFVNALGRR